MFTKPTDGFSLIEVLVTLGVASAILLTTLSMTDTLNRSNTNAQQQSEIVYLQSEIYSLLRDNSACIRTFTGVAAPDFGSTYSLPTQLRRADNTVAFQTGTPYAKTGLTIQNMEFGDFIPDNSAVNPNIGNSTLHLTIRKLGAPTGLQTVVRDIKIKVTRDNATRNVVNCVAIAGTRELWNLNPDGSIHYNGGNVGIGVSNPQVALDVNGEVQFVVGGKRFRSQLTNGGVRSATFAGTYGDRTAIPDTCAGTYTGARWTCPAGGPYQPSCLSVEGYSTGGGTYWNIVCNAALIFVEQP
jgi:prepilin-type N-terminal cleavage/methylation domain-containing protein